MNISQRTLTLHDIAIILLTFWVVGAIEFIIGCISFDTLIPCVFFPALFFIICCVYVRNPTNKP